MQSTAQAKQSKKSKRWSKSKAKAKAKPVNMPTWFWPFNFERKQKTCRHKVEFIESAFKRLILENWWCFKMKGMWAVLLLCFCFVFALVWRLLELSEALWSSLKLFEALWSSLKLSETLWSSLKLSEALWSSLSLSQAHWSSTGVKKHFLALRWREVHGSLLPACWTLYYDLYDGKRSEV